ncbi:hypothetical protein [Acetobacter senegalensis]|nr:hypothetical protein [Acetobacter senegalensis]MDN7352631.1 hypothetical protein [Acetobacter senegalensis]
MAWPLFCAVERRAGWVSLHETTMSASKRQMGAQVGRQAAGGAGVPT